MRLTELIINGFGIFHDIRIQDLSPGLSVFLGDNESGKSTLLGFLRAMMLGFPDGRSHENPYPPIAGGQHGGSMTLVSDQGEAFVVARRPGPRGGKVDVLKPDQTREGAAFLRSLLGPAADKALFKSIYAFSLTELQNFESLNRSAVREALYSAAGGMDPGVLARLKQALAKEEGDLFKAGGKNPQINTILARLAAIRKERRALSNPTERYDEIQVQMAELRNRIRGLEEKKTEKALEQKKTDRWLQLWPLWVRLSAARERLTGMESIEAFPANGLQRFDELKRRHADLEGELSNKKDNLKRQEERLSSLTPNPDILSQSVAMQQLQKDLGHYEAVVREMVSLNQELAEANYALQQHLKGLGPSWTEEKVRDFDLSIAVREEVRHFRGELQQAQRTEDKNREALDRLQTRKRETEQILEKLPPPPEEGTGHLQRMKQACRELRGLLSRQSLIQSELGHLAGRLDDLRREKEYLQEVRARGYQGVGYRALAAIALLGAGVLVWQVLRQDWAGAAGLGAFFLVLIFSLGFLARTQGQKNGVPRANSHLDRLNGREEDLAGQVRSKEAESEDLAGRVKAVAAALQLQEGSTIESVEKAEEELGRNIRGAERRQEVARDLEQLEHRISEGLGELETAETAREKGREEWVSWLRLRGLAPGLSTDGALEVLSLLALCREQVEKSKQIGEKIANLERTRDDYRDLTNQVLTACGRDPVPAEQIPITVRKLLQEFSAAEHAESERSLLLEEIASSRMSVERLAKQTSGLDEEIQGLLVSGGADSEETFRRRAQVFEMRTSLLQESRQQEESIRQLAGSLGNVKTVLETLSGMELEKLERDNMALKGALEEMEASLDNAKREEARLEEQVRMLMNDEALSELREEEETLKQALEALAEQWSALRLAQGLIRKARARYEKERQPEVIQRAGRFFEKLTLGRYTALVAPMGEDRIEVLSSENRQKEIGQLSRGTAEQLYLSLRFGFIREFCKNSEAPPIVMDEILVNFDRSRARAAARGILDLSRDHQVLFFTCHPWIAKIFREQEPHTPILEIKDGGIREWANPGPEPEV